MKTFIVPYKLYSKSAKNLARNLNIKLSSGKKKFIKGKNLIINWGNSSLDLLINVKVKPNNIILNNPENVRIASNKIKAFNKLKEYNISTVPWTTSRDEALSWIDENNYIYARTLINSSQGRGIKIVTIEDECPNVELYTKALPKTHEYRVHIFNNKVIDYTKKRKRSLQEANPYIKNYENGWVFCRQDVTLPIPVEQIALTASRALGLDFCALDILFKERDNAAFILEANTAPGLEGTTLEKYCRAI